MAWPIIAGVPVLLLCLFLALLYCVRFHYHAEYESPAALRFAAGVRFFWYRKSIAIEPGRALWGHENDNDEDEDETEASAASAAAGSPAAGNPGPVTPGDSTPASDLGQRGALSLPDAWVTAFAKLKDRLRNASAKWILDLGVWRLLIRYAWRAGRRVLWLLHPRLESLHLGVANAYDLARMAAAWSALAGTFPALACPVSYGFGAREFEARFRCGGRFTGLGVLGFALVSLTSFPWAGLASRFAHCWRDPRLARWQRRVLLP